MKNNDVVSIPPERIVSHIYLIHGKKVMLDSDLAELYDVPTKRLNEAVKRNSKRFPEEFMFQLSKEEFENWRSQIATSNPSSRMGLRRRPYVFTEQGVAMLSSVLRSDRAIEINIMITKTFVRMRELLETSQVLREKLTAMERQMGSHSKAIQGIYRLLQQHLSKPEDPDKGPMGFGNA